MVGARNSKKGRGSLVFGYGLTSYQKFLLVDAE